MNLVNRFIIFIINEMCKYGFMYKFPLVKEKNKVFKNKYPV